MFRNLVGGWATPLKNMKVNWDDEIPNIWENNKWQPNHQPETLSELQFYDDFSPGWMTRGARGLVDLIFLHTLADDFALGKLEGALFFENARCTTVR